MDEVEKQPAGNLTIKESFDLDKPGIFIQSQESGERDLRELATFLIDKEVVFVFDENNSSWYYFPSAQTIVQNYERRKIITTVPEEVFEIKFGKPCIYHTHPDDYCVRAMSEDYDTRSDIELVTVCAQVPKKEDLEAAQVLYKYGFNQFKIVTSTGITTVIFNPERLTPGAKMITGITVKKEEIKNLLSQLTFRRAVQAVLKKYKTISKMFFL